MGAPTVQHVHDEQHDAPGVSPGNCIKCQRGFRTCRKKRRYHTADDAHEAAVAYNVINEWARPLVAYRCCYCTLWHLTTARTETQLKRVRAMRRNMSRRHPTGKADPR